jgi:hypothetical protein
MAKKRMLLGQINSGDTAVHPPHTWASGCQTATAAAERDREEQVLGDFLCYSGQGQGGGDQRGDRHSVLVVGIEMSELVEKGPQYLSFVFPGPNT